MEAQESIRRLEEQLRQVQQSKQELEQKQNELEEMLKKLENDKAMEAEEKAKLVIYFYYIGNLIAFMEVRF